ncbi:uncharacterized protein [Littorina saxatilis]|uniref:Hedgehog N-terminal signalling domain-containing protein n=1 Tax=Littorina saxatilis TaxID=31220 RepID=A0AAN9FW36_9CAEN
MAGRIYLPVRLVFLVTCLCPLVTSSTSIRHDFKHDVDVGEAESGERLQLHSQGHLADIIDLDSLPQVKRVVCAGNRLLLAMTDSAVAHGWREGQVVLGGPRWGCNATQTNSSGVQIYVRVSQVVFTVEGRRDVSSVDMVTIHHVPAGPFDMLKEASIFFRYEAGKLQRQNHHHQGRHSDQARLRFRRSVSNLVSNVLDNIDWHANFTSVIPLLDTGDEKVTLHKPWGQDGLTVTTGANAASVTDDFILFLDSLTGENRLSYTFDLVIKNVKGNPHVVRYISQFDVESKMVADATVKFTREMGVSYNTTVRESPKQELLRIPVVKTVGMPPVYLVVTSQSLVHASVRAYSSGASTLKTGYSGNGFVTLSQQFDPTLNKGSDVTSREWSMQPKEQSLDSQHRTEVDFSLYQKLMFNAAISWHYHDIDLELSPPAEMTLRPAVSLQSSRPGVARCVDSSVRVDTDVSTAASQLTVTAFGLQLWDVPLQPSMSRSLHLTDAALGQFCDARCDGPSELLADITGNNPVQTFSRSAQQFQSLQKLDGNLVQFVDPGKDASWCGAPGTTCHNCSAHAYNTPLAQTCATRLMTSRLATAISHLAELVQTEWPQKQLLIVEAWDEPTSQKPSGAHLSTSLYKLGRAATIALTTRSPGLPSLGQWSLERLGQLAVCAGLEQVKLDTGNSRLSIAVKEDGARDVMPGDVEGDESKDFWDAVKNMDVINLHPQCISAPHMTTGSRWPDVTGSPDSLIGPIEKELGRSSRKDMATLVQFNLDDGSLTFGPEGQQDNWCGTASRQCIADCTSASDSQEPWDWCSTRMMTPRLAIRLRTLQKLAEKEGIVVMVKLGFQEKSQTVATPADIFNEGRALKLSTVPVGNESTVASLAVCAGFDFVEISGDGHVMVYVITQHGYRAQTLEFLEGSSHMIASSAEFDDDEHAVPTEDLQEESDLPYLVDGGYQPDVFLSEHVTTRDVTSRDNRFFRLDELLLLCVEMVIDDFPSKLEIMKDSAYRTRSSNFLHNLDTRHVEEQWRHQTGQAVRLRPLPTSNSSLLLLAKSVLRVCPTLTQNRLKGIGLGCHGDSVYVDVRPLEHGGALGFVKVWESGNTSYCNDVIRLQGNLLTGGPVIQSEKSVTCKSRGLDPGMEFIASQMGQTDLCQVPKQAEFCDISRSKREEAADRLQEVLTASAGHGRLPRFDIISDIRACLVDNCGGCMGSGPTFDKKVKYCSRVVHKYLERAAAPYPDLKDVTTFFNTDTDETSVHGEACKTGKVCVEETIIYSLLMSTVTARFYPDPKSSVERELFDASINPTPLLDIAAQELAARASGMVTVFIHAERDTYALRNVMKVLLTFNKNVSLVDFQVAPGVDKDLVTSSIQRKITAWAGVICPEHSRFAVAPFMVVGMDPARHKRSAELSQIRNQVKSSIYDWESEWLKKML